jgi:hypothetical protein
MAAASVLLPPEIIAAAGRGWRLFPVKAGDKKPPLLKDWPAKASCDLSQLEEWARRFPGCNWGLACGPESGVYVLDIDGEAGNPPYFWMRWTLQWVVTRSMRKRSDAY